MDRAKKTNTVIDVLLHPFAYKGDNVGGDGRAGEIPYWQGRAYAELSFARDVCERLAHELLPTVEASARRVRGEYDALGYVSEESVGKMESELARVSPLAKRFTMHCVGHAHIDMNWQWGYDETVNVVLSNLDATVALMKKFPFLTFAQSQASVYEIVEKFGPERLLDDIRALVKQGRWEVTASTWVENDENMPSGESLIRQSLYAKRYVAELLGIDAADICVAFEPDTFGHSAHMPKILSGCGMKYLYYNRGEDIDCPRFTRWRDGGAEIFCYRDTNWYNGRTEPALTDSALIAYDSGGTTHLLNIFGVGDHGGGPTRRDVERLCDMQSWACFPTIVFSTLRAFFENAEREADCPSVSGEKNAVFPGCYTTQTRIKRANRIAERSLFESEEFSAFYGSYNKDRFFEAWHRVLFNHFHDIITGSNVRDSREFALGRYQEALAYANGERAAALRGIAESVDCSAFLPASDDKEDTAFGAGVGSVCESGAFSACGASGDRRVFTFYNPLNVPRTEVVKISLWDWREPELVRVSDADGNDLPFQLVDSELHGYWGHFRTDLLVKVGLPPMGYNCLLVSKAGAAPVRRKPFGSGNPETFRETEKKYVLENGFARVELDPATAAVKSWVDKRTGRELIDRERGGGVFRFVMEEGSANHPAWRIFRYRSVRPLTENVRIVSVSNGALRSSAELEIPFESSRLNVTVRLDGTGPAVTFDCVCDWRERGDLNKGFPHLDFVFPLPFAADEYEYDVPFGTLKRPSQDLDVPAGSFIHAQKDGAGMMLFADSKYGFRGTDNALAVTLVHASDRPDPCPESGRLEFSLTLAPTDGADPLSLISAAARFNAPVSAVCTDPHEGTLPTEHSFCSVSGAFVAAVKQAEDGGGMIVRLVNPLDRDVTARVSASRAMLCGALEDLRGDLPVTDGFAAVPVPARGFATVKLILQ